MASFFCNNIQCSVDYDVFATSYYPYWHGTPDALKNTLGNIAKTYNKKVLVAETSWANSFENKDPGSNTISSKSDLGNYVSYPVGADGQIAFLNDLFRAMAAIPDGRGIGVFYWEPECYNGWKQYAKGAFDNSGKPTKALDAFK